MATDARMLAERTAAALSTRGSRPLTLERYAALLDMRPSLPGAPVGDGPFKTAPADLSPESVPAIVSTPVGDVRATDVVMLAIAQLTGLMLDRQVTPPADAVTASARAVAAIAAGRHPGKTVEVRVPPAVAVQIGFGHGPVHTRGTPPNVIEMDPATFVRLGTGHLGWEDALATHLVRASGDAADLSPTLPLLGRRGLSASAAG